MCGVADHRGTCASLQLCMLMMRRMALFWTLNLRRAMPQPMQEYICYTHQIDTPTQSSSPPARCLAQETTGDHEQEWALTPLKLVRVGGVSLLTGTYSGLPCLCSGDAASRLKQFQHAGWIRTEQPSWYQKPDLMLVRAGPEARRAHVAEPRLSGSSPAAISKAKAVDHRGPGAKRSV